MILISPYAKAMRNGKKHPKNYPYWEKIVSLIGPENIIQIGVNGEAPLVPDCRFNLPFKEVKKLIDQCDFFISVDTFLPHMAHYYGKKGIVIFSQSDPKIFGYPDNINLLKDNRFIRENQFWLWEQCSYKENAFVKPEAVLSSVNLLRNK